MRYLRLLALPILAIGLVVGVAPPASAASGTTTTSSTGTFTSPGGTPLGDMTATGGHAQEATSTSSTIGAFLSAQWSRNTASTTAIKFRHAVYCHKDKSDTIVGTVIFDGPQRGPSTAASGTTQDAPYRNVFLWWSPNYDCNVVKHVTEVTFVGKSGTEYTFTLHDFARFTAAPPADPETMADVSVICDATTNTVSVSAQGRGYHAGANLKIVFEMYYGGSYVTATEHRPLIPTPGTTAVPVTTTIAGAWSAQGYSRSWHAADYLFYSEKARVTVLDATTNRQYVQSTGYCTHDTRTTVTFDCDPVAHTYNVHMAGGQFRPGATVYVRYYRMKTWKEGFTTIVPGPDGRPVPERTTTVHVGDDGTWSDPGVSGSHGETAVYTASQWMVEVTSRDPIQGVVQDVAVGRGEGICVTAHPELAPPT